jgi:2,5-diamino-6-(ribosylamino)-4(3H)-pyrimidinone 5'-phosphate reductase
VSDDRPRILINFAVSIDGKINPAPGRRQGEFAMSRGKEDWRRMRVLREQVDAILIGAGNLRADNPGLSLEPSVRDRRRAAGEPLPARIVITSHGEGVRPDAKMFDPGIGGPAYVVHAGVMPRSVRASLAPVVKLVQLGDKAISIADLLAWMRRELGARTVLCEGGGQLVAALFAARAVDEAYLTLVPRILGGTNAPTLVGGAGFSPDEIPDARLVSLERVEDELYLRYDFPWS